MWPEVSIPHSSQNSSMDKFKPLSIRIYEPASSISLFFNSTRVVLSFTLFSLNKNLIWIILKQTWTGLSVVQLSYVFWSNGRLRIPNVNDHFYIIGWDGKIVVIFSTVIDCSLIAHWIHKKLLRNTLKPVYMDIVHKVKHIYNDIFLWSRRNTCLLNVFRTCLQR